MSRAFVKETDADAIELPDRPVSVHPNFVTAERLVAIERELDRLTAANAATVKNGDKAAVAAVQRDLRYWTARRTQAACISARPSPCGATTAERRPSALSVRTKRNLRKVRCPTPHRWRARCTARRLATPLKSRAARRRFWRSSEANSLVPRACEVRRRGVTSLQLRGSAGRKTLQPLLSSQPVAAGNECFDVDQVEKRLLMRGEIVPRRGIILAETGPPRKFGAMPETVEAA